MYIVNRNKFIALPEGTVFAEIEERWNIGNLMVKVENSGTIDFYETNFTWVDANDSEKAINRLEEMWDNPKVHYSVDKAIGRNGLFLQNAKYLIYESNDIKYITELLNTLENVNTIKVAEKEVSFLHTAVNKDMHLFIDGTHSPNVCPECIQPGILIKDNK